MAGHSAGFLWTSQMKITRKTRFEAWPSGASEMISQHNELMEAVESCHSFGPGVHTVRVGGEIYLEVSNPDAGLRFVDIGGAPHVLIENLSVFANGVEQQVSCPITWDQQSAVELRFSGKVIGKL
jgi:hypothetical protein